MTAIVDLSPAAVDAVARRVVELMRAGAGPVGLIDAKEVARILGVSRGWVYEHKATLGAIRVGGRWCFDPAVATATATAERSSSSTPNPEPTPDAPAMRQPRRRSHTADDRMTASGAPLLPVKRSRP